MDVFQQTCQKRRLEISLGHDDIIDIRTAIIDIIDIRCC